MDETRGVAHVLGVILMGAFAITIATTVAVAGVAMIQDTEGNIETSQAESSFSTLASDAANLADGETTEFDLGTADGDLRVVEDTGQLTIRHTDHGSIYDESINSLEYTNANGDTVAYQGGGVFRQQGGGSTVVSAPDFDYRENALDFPIQIVDGDVQTHGTLSGELTLTHEAQHYPVPEDGKTNPLNGGIVFIELESDYCQGWEEYFDQQTRGSVSETCSETGETTDGEVQVELSVPFELEEETFTNAVTTGTIENGDQADFDYEEDGDFDGPSADSLIDNVESECETMEDEPSGDIEDGGLHCFEEIDGSYTIDTTDVDEEIDIYVNDTLTVGEGGLPVEGESKAVNLFIQNGFDLTGDVKNDDVVGNKDSPEQTRIYVSSDGYVFSDGDNMRGDVYAMVYAPESEAYIQSSGNSVFTGSMIVDKLTVGSSMDDEDVSLSEDAPEQALSYEGAGPEFYYLHVSEKTITVE